MRRLVNVADLPIRDAIAKIVVPCLFPTGQEGKCTVATVDQFGPALAERFMDALDDAGYVIVPKDADA